MSTEEGGSGRHRGGGEGSVGVNLWKRFLYHHSGRPSLQYRITPLLHYSTRPRPWFGSGSIPMRDSDFPIWVRHDAGDSSEGGILIEVTQKVDTANAELQRSGKINNVIGRGQT